MNQPAGGSPPGAVSFEQPVRFGKYVLLDRISIGGMAEVFKAKLEGVEGFEKILAIKRILPALVKDKEFIEMFVDEAKIAGQLTQENICPIYELGKVGEAYYIAMEHIWGKDLLQIINRFRRMRKFMPPVMAAWVASKICGALDYAHRKTDANGKPLNIIHRDISPQNIIVGYEGQVKLIDFGIAKAASRTTRTRAGVLKGKFGYMSPEQVRGLELDPRSDIFTVGTCLWEMAVCGRLFLGESDFSTLEKVRRAKVARPSAQVPNLPVDFEDIIMRALERDPKDRFQSAAAMLEALQGFLSRQTPPYGTSTLASWMKSAFTQEVATERGRIDKLIAAEAHPQSGLRTASQPAAAEKSSSLKRRSRADSLTPGTVKLEQSEIGVDDLTHRGAQDASAITQPDVVREPALPDQPTFVFFSSTQMASLQAQAAESSGPPPPPLSKLSAPGQVQSLPQGLTAQVMPDAVAGSNRREGSWRKAIAARHEPSASWKIPTMNAYLNRPGLIPPSTSSRRSRRFGKPTLWISVGILLLGITGWGLYLWFSAPERSALKLRTAPKAKVHVLEPSPSKVASVSTPASPLPEPEPQEVVAAEQDDPVSTEEPASASSQKVGYLGLRSTPTARIFIDGEDSGRSTPQRRMRIRPGPHQIELKTKDGRSVAFEVRIRAGERTRIRKQL